MSVSLTLLAYLLLTLSLLSRHPVGAYAFLYLDPYFWPIPLLSCVKAEIRIMFLCVLIIRFSIMQTYPFYQMVNVGLPINATL